MGKLLTTTEAAERLAERGIVVQGRSGLRPPDGATVTAWCRADRFPGAIRQGGPRRGVWLIPEEAVDTFEPPVMGRPPDDDPSPTALAQRRSRERRRHSSTTH